MNNIVSTILSVIQLAEQYHGVPGIVYKKESDL